ncbi:unnamed protein product [Cylicostephanus goldi]|uniref:Peptidase A2 domain-containing protein n=1 Tax=Cylicostephanus goldi TaxID=71465 RepID=A0A3P6SHN9_CYLGO|nr:unnamed protein product [Cylicostephanus goldi]
MASSLGDRKKSRSKSEKKRKSQVNAVLVEEAPAPHEPLFVPRIYSLSNYKETKHHRLPQVVTALMDSGATITYMRKETADQLGLPYCDTLNKTWPKPPMVHLCLGRIMEIGSYNLPHKLYVAQESDCTAPVLLGTDFIEKLNRLGLKLTIDLHNNSLTIGDNATNLINNVEAQTPYNVRLIDNVLLPRRSNNIVQAIIEGYFSTRPLDFFIEDNLRPYSGIYIVGRCLVNPILRSM